NLVVPGVGDNQLLASIDALAAEIAMGQLHLVEARERAQSALEIAQRADLPDIACHVLEVLGRAARVHDLDAAERYFATALQLAERQGLVVRPCARCMSWGRSACCAATSWSISSRQASWRSKRALCRLPRWSTCS